MPPYIHVWRAQPRAPKMTASRSVGDDPPASQIISQIASHCLLEVITHGGDTRWSGEAANRPQVLCWVGLEAV